MSDEALMEISNDGFEWWVLGYIKYPKLLNLPKWDGGKFKVIMPNGNIEIITNEFQSVCGDVVTLKNGTKCKLIRP